MSNSSSRVGRWIAAALAVSVLVAISINLVIDTLPKGEVRKIDGYVPWSSQTLDVASMLPVQDGGRIKPLSSYAGFTMLGLHGARSMTVEDGSGKRITIKSLAWLLGDKARIDWLCTTEQITITPLAWLMDSLFRPQLAIHLPTFRVDNSAVIEGIGLKARGKRDRYSYQEIEAGREKLIELAKSYEAIEKAKRDPVQTQTIDLAYNVRSYESLLSYFDFARYGVVLRGTGKDGAADQHADMSAVMLTAPQIREQVAKTKTQGLPMEAHLQELLEQVVDAANFGKFSLFILPPLEPKVSTWASAGAAIMSTISDQKIDPQLAISDIKMLETTARSAGGDESEFRSELSKLRDRLVKRAEARNEYQHVAMEAGYYKKNWFLSAMIYYICGTVTALAMWLLGKSRIGSLVAWVTLGTTATGLVYCIIPIVERCVIMQRPPVGNLYDTIIFIATTVVLFSLVIEWMTRRRFALGIAPILGALLIILARRFELGDAKDHMDPLVAVLNSNYWLTIHVLTITLGYAAGLLSAFLAFIYLLMRGLQLDRGDKEIRRSLTRAVYGMLCLTLFLALVGTVLGGIWANDSWGRFWGWDPKENGALLIVLWMLAILHARLGGYIREWGLHLASVFSGAVVAFSWWHVNFLGVGLHNYGFTAGKGTIWLFYLIILAILVFGVVARAIEQSGKSTAND